MEPPRDSGHVVIACAADAAYVRPLATMLRSVIDNLAAHRSADFYILHSGIAADVRALVTSGWPASRFSAHWIEADESKFAGLPLWGRMPVATYFKLALPEMLPEPVTRALWLDCDLVVLADIGELWDIGLDGTHLLAAQDAIVPLVSSRCGIAGYRDLELSADAPYFNAGVLSLDVGLWRRDSVSRRATDYLKAHEESVTFWDQEGLNAVLAGKWSPLPPRWNHNASVPHRGGKSSQLPAIVHFAGNLKPWRFLTRHPLRKLYYEYLDRTEFAGARPRPTIAASLITRYEESGLRSLLYPAENAGMRLVRDLSRR